MGQTEGFVAELKRRNVVRVGLAYAAVAWLVIEASSVVLPTFGAPGWIQPVLTFLVILGLPLALVLAWAFELTPDGLKRERDIDRSVPGAVRSGGRLTAVTIAVLAAAVVFLVVERMAWIA